MRGTKKDFNIVKPYVETGIKGQSFQTVLAQRTGQGKIRK